MQNQRATVMLRDALASLPSQHDAGAKEALRRRVSEFVDAAKAEGWPNERVIVALKQVAADAGVRSSTDILRTKSNLQRRDALILVLVRWCVEHYYEYTRKPGSANNEGAGLAG